MYKLIFSLFFILFISAFSYSNSEVSIVVSVEKSLEKNWEKDGRLIVFFSKNNLREPIFQGTFSAERFGIAQNIAQWNFGEKVELTKANSFSSSSFSLDKIPAGKWYVQAVYNVSEDPQYRNGGNFYSEVNEVEITGNQHIELSLTKTIKSRNKSQLKNTDWVHYIELESKLLSEFWGRPMSIKASVLFPKNYDMKNARKYPVRINIGGYGSSWTRASRLENDSTFMAWWQSEDGAEFINIFPHGDSPFGDPYYLDSENSGPYGSALTQELIPFIEEEYNGIGKPAYRFVDGCSTGGWVSLALQIFYPDYFNGAWSFSADPVDFHHMQLVNMYDDNNAFYNRHGYLNPSIRSKTGQPILSIQAEVTGENISSFENTFATSGGQWGGWNALYSPKGDDGLPLTAFHPLSGEIDSTVVENWEKFDLLKILKDNWKTLGPKLQGKIWVWMGDMDQFYLNNAMREMDVFLKSTDNPKSDAQINFEATKGHCEEFDHRWVLEMMQEKVKEISSAYN